MFKDFNDFKNKMNGKKAVVVGIGVSNTPLIKLLCSFGATVTACDKKQKEALENRETTLSVIKVDKEQR